MIDMEFLLAMDKVHEIGAPVLRRRNGVLSLISTAEELRRRADLVEEQALQAQKSLKAQVAKVSNNAELNRAKVEQSV